MGELDEIDFGADTDAIRGWLAKRATYADDTGDPVRGGKHRVVPNARDAEQDVLDALVAPQPPVAAQWPAPYQPVAKEPVDPVADATPDPAAEFPTPPPRTGTTPGERSPYASTPEREEVLTASSSTNAVFKPRAGSRHAITLILLVVAALMVTAGYQAYQERTTVNYGLALLLALLTLLVFAVRATTSVTELAVIRGQLEMIRNGKFEVIDLASPYTPILVEGRPGRRDWRVLVERHDQPLLVLDRTMVDPEEFTAVLHRLRPDLRPAPAR